MITTTTRLFALMLAAVAPAAQAEGLAYFGGALGTISRADTNAVLNALVVGSEDFEALPMPPDTSVPSFTQNGVTYEAMTAWSCTRPAATASSRRC